MATNPDLQLLLIEDDPGLGQAVADHLRAAGHTVRWCQRIAQARSAPRPMLALLDLRLPDGDGLDLLRDWRSAGRTWPVIVLTARDQVSDRIRGLQAGADDYLVKPFDLDELLARINAVVRRVPGTLPGPGTVSATGLTGAANQPGHWQLDLDAHSAWRGGERLDLTQMDWAVLACLAQRRGRIYSRNDIEGRLELTGLTDAASNSLGVIISRLRKRLGVEAISTHRGLGYRLEP